MKNDYTKSEKTELLDDIDFRVDTPPETYAWETPIPFDNIALPKFPIDCLPDTLKNYIEAVAESTQTTVDMSAVAALSAMAVCVQGKYKIQGKPDWTEPLNLYCVFVANPAERKSTVLNHMTEYIYEYEKSANEKLKPVIERNRTEKDLLEKQLNFLKIEVVKNKKSKGELLSKQDELTAFQDMKYLRLIADDASPEALTSLLAENGGKMAVISSEGGIFETLNGKYTQGVNIDTFLKAHCGDPIRIDRKGRDSEYIDSPCMTVLLSIQPQVLDGLVSNEVFRGRGLTARFLYSIPISSMGSRKEETAPIPEQIKAEYRSLCFELLDIPNTQNTQTITLSDEARALSRQFFYELEPRLIDDLENMADFAGKLHGAILRIAGILHVVNQLVFANDTPVPEKIMRDAIKIGYYFLEHSRAAYQLMGADEQEQNAKYVLSKLEKRRVEKFTKNDLMKICRKFKRVDDLNEPISLLMQFNYLRACLKSQKEAKTINKKIE